MKAGADSGRMRDIVILGGGTAGWMAAAVLARGLGNAVRITLVESAAIGTVGVGEATIPQIQHLNRFLGLDEGEFLKASEGTIKLGIRFEGWWRADAGYIHAFSDIGVAAGLIGFHHYWLRARKELGPETAGDLWDHSLNAVAAARARFAPMDRVGETPVPGTRHAYHFDASLYARLLRSHAESMEVRRIEGRVVAVERVAESGEIAALLLDDERRVAGDFFIDCSGFRALLIESEMQAGFEDWSHWLPCDRAVAVGCAPVRPYPPFTQAFARPAGWQWRIPLRHRTGNGHVYASALIDDDEATRTLLDHLDGAPVGEPRVIRFRAGRRRAAWVGNCLALGLAGGFLEPLESTSIHLVQSGLQRFLEMWPARPASPALVAEYNHRTAKEWEAIRDFLILHYHRNARTDGELWRACREMTIPDRLAQRLALFAESARIYPEPDELFTEMAWLQVMIGQGLYPNDHHPIADLMPADELADFLARIREIIARAVSAMPSHDEFLARIS
ncbi:MAG: tryptophan 7-halogenase [Alphaproteobacteria bacterium]|nr:MAG: tryptophan 7-halogenase [Alphaproteobacteria bacterium]